MARSPRAARPRHLLAAPGQEQYEQAIDQVLISLRRTAPSAYSTFDELVSAYYASEATDEIEAACRATGVLLTFGVVEDTAHW